MHETIRIRCVASGSELDPVSSDTTNLWRDRTESNRRHALAATFVTSFRFHKFSKVPHSFQGSESFLNTTKHPGKTDPVLEKNDG